VEDATARRSCGGGAWRPAAGLAGGGGEALRRDSRLSSSFQDAVGKEISQGEEKKKNESGPHLSVGDSTFDVFGPNRKWVRPIPLQPNRN
jgi:hypothetical protein